MSNQLVDLLAIWYQQKTDFDWVLGTIVNTQGSSYRKTGAMMFINSLGQYHGLLSGGCLEGDLLLHAKQVMQTGQAKTVVYDMQQEDELGWHLGIGCGGRVDILLQPISKSSNFQALTQLFNQLYQSQDAYYCLSIDGKDNNYTFENCSQALSYISQNIKAPLTTAPSKNNRFADKYLLLKTQAKPHIAIFGGGIDARPLAKMALNLGWNVTVVDHRSSYARAEYFTNCRIIRDKAPLPNLVNGSAINAAIVMGHNVEFDSQALVDIAQLSPVYTGLLGPVHRKEKVTSLAFKKYAEQQSKINQGPSPLLLSVKFEQFINQVIGPIGLNIGGELPESIALSILAQIHCELYQADGQNLNVSLADCDKQTG
ncbi:XdhC family protein [Catenovulum sp. SM1970]|uniref:XdhC family protein n=1 Tax=Marinifaba aquimaris TaxID=2741323 RepID=UPI001571E243|nr:XdhC family protein [Marinifaba aquimaris]NTS77582.1 XdhC family protein [Marinifaba aquimaris]